MPSITTLHPLAISIVFVSLTLMTGRHPVSAQLLPTPSVMLPGSYYDDSRKPLEVQANAPDFTLPLVQGSRWQPPGVKAQPVKGAHPLKLSHFIRTGPKERPPVTLLIFWAFWCDTWKDVTSNLYRLRSTLKANGVQVLCVAVDASQQPVARRALDTGRIWYPVVIDRGSEITALYGVRRVPTLFVLDGTRRVQSRFEGVPTDAHLMKALRSTRSIKPR